MRNLSVSNLCWPAETDQFEFFRYLSKNQFSFAEIAPTKLFGSWNITEAQYALLSKVLQETSIKIVSMQSLFFGINYNVFLETEAFVEHFKKVLKIAEKISCPYVVFGSPKNRKIPAGLSYEDAENIFIKAMDDVASSSSVQIGLEANAPQYDCNFITSYDDFKRLSNRLHSNIRFHLDTGCSELVGLNSGQIFESEKNKISCLHISEPNLMPLLMDSKHVEFSIMLQDFPGFISLEMKEMTIQQLDNSISAYRNLYSINAMKEIQEMFQIFFSREPNKAELDWHSKDMLRYGKQHKNKEFSICEETIETCRTHRILPHKLKFEEPITYSKKYRVALCLSGHVRNFRETLPLIQKYIVDPLNADVFIHTWNTAGIQIPILDNVVGPVPNDNIKFNPEIIKNFIKVEKMLVESNKDFISSCKVPKNVYLFGIEQKNKIRGSAEPPYILSQLYSVFKANDLREMKEKETGNLYDFVIKLRADYAPCKSIDEKDIVDAIAQGCIFVPDSPTSNHNHPSCFLCKKEKHQGDHACDVCDVFAYGNSPTMSHYSRLYTDAIKMYDIMVEENNVMTRKDNIRHIKFKTFTLIDIWKKGMHKYHCFYPERLFRRHLVNFRLSPASLSGKLIR